MKRILENNETAYFKRYGISLSNKWDSLSESERTDAIKKYYDTTHDMMSSELDFEKDTILRIVIGCGNGLEIRRIIANSLPTLRALIWEPDEAFFLACCCSSDISELLADNRLMIITGRDAANLELAVRLNLFDSNYSHSKIIAQGIYTEKDNKDVCLLVSILESVSEEITLGGRLGRELDTLPCENLLQTIRMLNDNFVVSQLFEALQSRDIPVIIVSAGPSLMKNCRELKIAKNKAVIVAVAHAMKTLHRENIVPDLVAISDGAVTRYLDSDEERNNLLLCSVFADKVVQRNYNGSIIYHGFKLQSDIFVSKRTSTEPQIRLNTGSVSTDVFSLFISAGFKNIILVGQDLAYAPNGSSHTEDETEYSLYEENGMISYTEGINGESVRTRRDWEDFRKIFEDMINRCDNINVIDATEGGALIHGTRIMALKDAINIYCTKSYPIDKWLVRMKCGSEEEKIYIFQWFEDSLYDIKRIIRYLDEVIDLNLTIRRKWEDNGLWDNNLSNQCRRYDVLYDQIVNGDAGNLMRFYCTREMHDYFADSMTAEGDENIILRMRMEYDLFVALKRKSQKLTNYINGLITE